MSGQPPSKKWVDYSDSDSSEGPQRKQSQMSSCKSDHKSRPGKQTPTKIKYSPSRQETNKELDKLDKLDNLKVDEVWVDVFSQNLDYLEKEMHQQKAKAKKGGNIVQVFCTKQSTLYQLKVYINTAYQWIQRGYDSDDYLKISVSERNFDKITRRLSPKRYDQVKKSVSGEEEKKKYVDKKSSKTEDLEKEKLHNEQKIQTKEESKGEKYLEKAVKKEEKMYSGYQEEPSKKTESVIKEEPKLQEEPAPKKKEEKPVQVKKEKEVKKAKKQVTSKNIKSSNPFDGMLDL